MTSPYPPGRYGRRREPRRRRPLLVALLATATVLAMLAVTVRLYTEYGRSGYEPTVLRLEPAGETDVTVTFVVAKPGGGSARCLLRAMDRDTLVEFYFQGRSLVEMSEKFASPVGTIKRRLHVARKRLAKELESLAPA